MGVAPGNLSSLGGAGELREVLPSTAQIWILAVLYDQLFEPPCASSPPGASVCLSSKWARMVALTEFIQG